MGYDSVEGFGAITRYFELLSEVSKRDTVHLIIPKNYKEESNRNIKVHRYSLSRLKPSLIWFWLIYSYLIIKINIKEKKIHYSINFNGNRTLPFALLSKLFKYKFIYFIRSDYYENYRAWQTIKEYPIKKIKRLLSFKLSTTIEKIILSCADMVIFQSQHTVNTYKENKLGRYDRYYIIHNNCNPSWIGNKKHIAVKKSVLNICFIGNIFETKGIMDLVKAIKILTDKKIDVFLHIIGDGPSATGLKKYIKKLEISSCVKIYGAKKNACELIPCFDLVILPTHADAFPNVLLEAIYYGTPVFGSKVGGVPYILPENMMFEARNPKSIASKILEYHTSNDFKLKIKKQLEDLKKKFTFPWAKEIHSLVTKRSSEYGSKI